jgi:hypothetical protein
VQRLTCASTTYSPDMVWYGGEEDISCGDAQRMIYEMYSMVVGVGDVQARVRLQEHQIWFLGWVMCKHVCACKNIKYGDAHGIICSWVQYG